MIIYLDFIRYVASTIPINDTSVSIVMNDDKYLIKDVSDRDIMNVDKGQEVELILYLLNASPANILIDGYNEKMYEYLQYIFEDRVTLLV